MHDDPLLAFAGPASDRKNHISNANCAIRCTKVIAAKMNA